jgi:PAS domain S-box-containing protein
VDALALLERQRVDAVISDILMPQMDGYRLCYEIRKRAHLHDLPIILHTFTFTSPGDEKLALEMGADKYLKKPASVETIITALHEVIAQPHAAPRPDALREVVMLKEYNERLVSKLKEKNTELLAQTEALRASEEHHRSVTDSATDAIITADAAGRICDWNPGAERIFGYLENEVRGQPLEMIMPPRYRDRHHGGMQRVLAGGEAHIIGKTVELEGLHRDGREFPLELSLSEWETSTGKFYTAIIRDITERKRAEEEMKTILRTMIDGFYLVDLEGRILEANDAYCAMIGYSREELRKIGVKGVEAIETQEVIKQRIQRILETGSDRFETKHIRKDGRVIDVEAAANLIRNSGRFFVFMRDITARKQAERQVVDAMNYAQTLLAASPIGIITYKASGQAVSVNAEAARLIGTTVENVQKQNFRELDSWKNSGLLKMAELTLATGRPQLFEGRAVTSGGIERFISCRFVPFLFVGEPHLLVLSQDIAERKQAEEALRRQAMVINQAHDTITITDLEGIITDVNAAQCQSIGRTREELIGKSVEIYGDDPTRGATQREIIEATRTRGEWRGEVVNVTAAGKEVIVECHTWLLRDDQGKATGLCGVAMDITERKRAEEQIQILAHAVETTNELISITDMNDRFTFVNKAFLQGYGYTAEEVLGQTPVLLASLNNPPELSRHIMFSAHTQGWRGELINRRKDGSEFPISLNVSPIHDATGQTVGLMGMAQDITEKKLLEEKFLHAQRLESIGTLAGGVAHDLNNALAPIMMGVELLKMQYPKESQILDMFETSAKRGADMVRQLLTFAKGAEGERVLLRPGHLVKELEHLIKGSFPKNLQLVVKCDPNLPIVLGDATQLHQILLNLCVNARDAMPHGGTLTLEAQSMEVDAVYASSVTDAKPGKYVALRVCDTGTGIPPEILDRIFDPFFTTKGPDKGTGLGLSTVMGIVKGHGGFLQVYSPPGQGSTFTAYLPAADAGSDTEHVTKAAVEFRGQGETILLVDDEAAMRQVARAVLRRLNFKPLTATDGADGLMQVAQHRTELRAIITDVHMPHMDGLAFVRTLRRMLPDIPVMVVSGRMEDTMAGEFKTLGVTSRLDKPFTEVQLAEALKKLLAPK